MTEVIEQEEWVISLQVSNDGDLKKVLSADVFETAEEAAMWIPDYMASPEDFSLTDIDRIDYSLEPDDILDDAEVILLGEDGIIED